VQGGEYLNTKIIAIAMLALVVLAVSSSGCIILNPDYRSQSFLSVKWLGGNYVSPAGLRISGQLLDGNNVGIEGKPIVLYGSNDATLNQPTPQLGDVQQVQLQTQTTDSQGKFAFTLKSFDDKYLLYSVVFPGDSLNNVANYKPSGTTVGGYRALLAVTNELTKQLISLPNSAFKPGTKVALLATLGTVSLQIKLGKFSTAAATLNSAFLKRMDGYANSGTPDTNDYVKTNAAQYTMYYRAYLVVKDGQWLSGGQDTSLAGAPSEPA
jgi:hypothetical protein